MILAIGEGKSGGFGYLHRDARLEHPEDFERRAGGLSRCGGLAGPCIDAGDREDFLPQVVEFGRGSEFCHVVRFRLAGLGSSRSTSAQASSLRKTAIRFRLMRASVEMR